MRVLIVDDNSAARILIGEMLRAHGHEIVGEAENLAQTLQIYKTSKPDLVTMDMSMAQEDGCTILRALRKADGGANVLMISGVSQQKLRDEAARAGARGFLAKPFSLEELGKAVSQAASRPASPEGGAGAFSWGRSEAGVAGSSSSEDRREAFVPNETARARLAQALRLGADTCSTHLARISGKPWAVDTIALGADSDDHFESLLDQIKTNYYGACSVSADAVFLCVFGNKGGFLVTDRFTRAYSDRFEALNNREETVLAEVSQLLANALAAPLAAASGTSMAFAAPEARIASPRDLMLFTLKKFQDIRRLSLTSYLRLFSEPLASDCLLLSFLSRDLMEKLDSARNP